MKSYNGFTPQQRQKAYNWLKAQIAAKHREPASAPCDACGQPAGRFDHHSEDYSAPYGDHIGGFTLCYPCHMMIHCRHRDKARFSAYAYMVKQGSHLTAPPQSWPAFRGTMLAGAAVWIWTEGTPPQRPILDEVEQGILDPRSRGGHW